MNAIILRRRKLGRTSCKEISANSKQGIATVRNDENIPAANIVFRWGTTTNVPKAADQIIVNEAKAIHWCAGKKSSRLEMQQKGVPVPETWDLVAFRADYHRNLLDMGPGNQFVLRRDTHAQGKDLWHGCAADIMDAAARHNVVSGYVSRLIPKTAEYRAFVAQGRVVWVAKKTPGNPNDVAWNVARGGKFDNVKWGDWPMQAVQAAILAAMCSGTDFCGVDVMTTDDGKPYVLEVNSAPSQTSPYRQQCVAKAFDWIVAKGSKEVIPCEQFKKWRDVAHPAILPLD